MLSKTSLNKLAGSNILSRNNHMIGLLIEAFLLSLVTLKNIFEDFLSLGSYKTA